MFEYRLEQTLFTEGNLMALEKASMSGFFDKGFFVYSCFQCQE